MDFVKLFLGLICLISMTDGAERCYACYSCNRVEPSSQSIQCEDYQNLCMRANLPTGEVDRRCVSEEECEQARQKASYSNVTCCAGDNCNTATPAGIRTTKSGFVFVAFSVLSIFHIFG